MDEPKTQEQAEIEAAERELEAAVAARRAREDAARPKATLAETRRAIEREKVRAELDEKYGDGALGRDYALLDTQKGLVAVARAKGPAFKAFQERTAKDGYLDRHVQELVTACVVHPEKGQYDALIRECPGVPAILAGMIYDLAKGHAREVEGK